MQILEFISDNGRSPFADWFSSLDAMAAAKVTTGLLRLEQGNVSNVKALGGGLAELRIHWGPGLRIYFGQQAATIVILLCGGTKRRQAQDIEVARTRWAEFRSLSKGTSRWH